MSYITIIEADLVNRGIPFVHLSAKGWQAKAARNRLQSYLKDPLDPYRYRFIQCRVYGASVVHVPVLILEDKARMDPVALREAMCIPAPQDKFGAPLIIEVMA